MLLNVKALKMFTEELKWSSFMMEKNNRAIHSLEGCY